MTADIIRFITSSAKLDRDKGLNLLGEYLNNCSSNDIKETEKNILDCFLRTAGWEEVHGGLLGAKCLVERGLCTDTFAVSVTNHATTLLDHEEFRVRIGAGEVLGALCKLRGIDIYSQHKQIILTGIETNLERDVGVASDGEFTDNSRTSIRDAAQIFHDSAGWKNLETWMKCLQCMIDGCGHLFNPCIDQTLLDLLFCCLTHTNRFVRETGYYVCASLVSCGMNEQDCMVMEREGNAIYQHGGQFSQYLAKGLSDNWSMVRLAASVATRKFFTSLPTEVAREMFYPALLPRMCLNRYYVAEGVRIYSQDTWVQICGERGKELVEKHIDHVVQYYIDETEAENHAVREAACSCIAELGYKIDRDCMVAHIPRLIEALVVCFNDDSWPVRDAACVACGNFIKCFPDETRPSMTILYPLFFTNLQDNISSVRQGASQALANVVRAYGLESFELVRKKILAGLCGVEEQPVESESFSGLERGPGAYGVVKRLRDNDMELHTDQQMYSCGSLAPKMGRGNRGGGCMDHMFRKPAEPWELADGCVNLVADLSGIAELDSRISQMLPQLVGAVSYRHYTHHVVLLTTFCSRLPDVAKGISKKHFKTHLESMFNPIFYALSCDNELASSAADQCLKDLGSYLGRGILRGRVEQYDYGLLSRLDEILSSVS